MMFLNFLGWREVLVRLVSVAPNPHVEWGIALKNQIIFQSNNPLRQHWTLEYLTPSWLNIGTCHNQGQLKKIKNKKFSYLKIKVCYRK